MRNSRAFTIVEIIIVIAVAAILSSIAVYSFSKTQKESRDAKRQGNATIVSEALEKYYDAHGEYPSVASIVNTGTANTGAAIASKLSIPADSLIMPKTPEATSNAISPLAPTTDNDSLTYIATSADNNTACQTDVSSGCDEFTLQYFKEAAKTTVAIESRHRSRPGIQKPELAVHTASTSTIDVSWTNVVGATSYDLQRSTASDMSAPTSSSHTALATTAASLTPDTEYFFRVRALLPSGSSEWSDVQSDTTSSLSTPSGTVTIIAAMSGTNARGTAGGGSCPAGTTIERQIRYRINDGSWEPWATGSPRDVAATEGYTYTFQSRARCGNGTTNGPWLESTTASVTRSVTAPSGLTIAATMSGTNAIGTADGGSCAAGTTMERQIRYTVDADAYNAYVTGATRSVAASQGSRYTFQQQARCVGTYASSAYVASATSAVVRPISTPSAPGTSASASGEYTNWTSGNTCPAGTSPQYQGTQSANHVPAYSSGWGVQSSNILSWYTLDGHTYTVTSQIRCVTPYATSGWSSASSATYKRPVAPPTNEGNITFSISFTSTRKSRTITYPPPTCRAGARPVYRWNSYMSNFNWVSTGAPGWYYGNSTTYPNLWSPTEYTDPNPNVFTSPSVNPYPANLISIHRVQYKCENTTLSPSESSAWGTVKQSGNLTG